jgi:hypothetical protein
VDESANESFIAIANLGFVVGLCDARTPRNVIETVRREAFPNTRPTDPSERRFTRCSGTNRKCKPVYDGIPHPVTPMALDDLSTPRPQWHDLFLFISLSFYFLPQNSRYLVGFRITRSQDAIQSPPTGLVR